jgi:hypothetical protein
MRRSLSLTLFGMLLTMTIAAAAWYVCSRPQAEVSGAHGMNPYDKDRIDAFVKLLGIGTVLVAAVGAWTSADTRRRELRRQLVRDAHEAILEIHADSRASEAVRMMDSFLAERPFTAKDPSAGCVNLSAIRAWAALAAEGRGMEGSEFVYDCFDWFLYYVDRIARLARRDLIDSSDVGAALRPYAQLIITHRAPFDDLAKKHGYDEVMEYLTNLQRTGRAQRIPVMNGRGDR